MKKIMFGYMVLLSFSTFAANYQLLCTGINILENANGTADLKSFEYNEIFNWVQYSEVKEFEANIKFVSPDNLYTVKVRAYFDYIDSTKYRIDVQLYRAGLLFSTDSENKALHVVSGKNEATEDHIDFTCEVIKSK